ncbi:hypothetical protein [Paenibacillus lutrae]|uniref:Uncharacterized protein n=1 Tax=Paenibacillus lutrae TaxID=2078573 RepID=A0A7X3JY14_9BACL|nr:hypothetical protein [Paenibacillus lutrae]
MPPEEEKPSWIRLIAKPLLERRPSLYPIEEWDSLIDVRIGKLQVSALSGNDQDKEPYALALKAGLYLLNESLDNSHEISQDITNDTGSYWHGLMHRMEGDYSNAKHWLQDVGNHPIHTVLMTEVRAYLEKQPTLNDLDHEAMKAKLDVLLTSPEWNSSVFTDVIELQVTLLQNPEIDTWLTHIQYLEIKLLLAYCYRQCYGGELLELAEPAN